MNLEAALREFLDAKNRDFRGAGKSFVMSCINPACGKEDHLYMRKGTGRAICFKCGEKWDWRGVVSVLEKCSRDEAWGILFGGSSGGQTETQDEKLFDQDDPFASLAIGNQEKPIHFLGPDFIPVERSLVGLEYLASRGSADPQTIIDFDIRWHAAMKAVVFPIRRAGVLYGWQARRVAPEEGQIRLISHGGMTKSCHLLNYDRASKMDSMFIVEGPFDCLKPSMAGFGGVATLGKQVSLEQVRMIMQSGCERVYNGLDPDAFMEVYDLNSRMGLGKRLFRVRPPEGREDFGACDPEEVVESVHSAIEITSQADLLEVYFES